MMEKTIETISATRKASPIRSRVPIQGSREAPHPAYIQAALHAGELPGTVAIDALMPRLRQAES